MKNYTFSGVSLCSCISFLWMFLTGAGECSLFSQPLDYSKFQSVTGGFTDIRMVSASDEPDLFAVDFPFQSLVRLTADENGFQLSEDIVLPDSEGHTHLIRVQNQTFSLKKHPNSVQTDLLLLQSDEWSKIASFSDEIAPDGIFIWEEKIIFSGYFESVQIDSLVSEFPGIAVFDPQSLTFHSAGFNSDMLYLNKTPVVFEVFQGKLFAAGHVSEAGGSTAFLTFLEGDLMTGHWKNDYDFPAYWGENNQIISAAANDDFLFVHTVEGYIHRKDTEGNWIKSIPKTVMEAPFRISDLEVCSEKLLLFGKVDQLDFFETNANLLEFPLDLSEYQILTFREKNNPAHITEGIGKVKKVRYLNNEISENQMLLFTGDNLSVNGESGGAFIYNPDFVSSVEVLEKEAMTISVFPNPTADFVTVRFENVQFANSQTEGRGVVTLYSPQGISLKKETGGSSVRFNVSDFPSGNYFIRFDSDKGSIVKSLVVQ